LSSPDEEAGSAMMILAAPLAMAAPRARSAPC
jgi:hypothetical protein